MKNKLLLLLILFITNGLIAQNYIPIDTADSGKRTSFIKDFKLKNDRLTKEYKTNYSGKTLKELVKNQNEFEDFFIKNIEDKNYTFNSTFEGYVQNIIKELKKDNPEITKSYQVLIAKTNIPNAYCLPGDILIVNMGLFNWLSNKDQISSVIAHELSHNILDHSLKSQLHDIAINKENKSVVNSLKKTTNGKTKLAFDLFKKQTYENSTLKRKHEIEADSLGYLLYRKGNFVKTEYINAFNRLEIYDTISSYSVLETTYKKLFNLPNQAFKDKWMAKEDFSAYNYDLYKEKMDKDSISSHPESEERIRLLKTYFKELNLASPKIKADKEFDDLSKIARLEILPNLYSDESYGVGIYVCLQFLQEGEEESYYKKWLGKCFEKIYEGRKNYKLNHYLDRLEPKDQSQSYQTFLNFMWNLKLDEIKFIADFYK